MFAAPPEVAAITDEALEAIPNSPAVFRIQLRDGEPYLGKTAMLRRRLLRLLRVRATPSKLLNLREVATRVEYWPSASRLESSLVLYELARSTFPDRCIEFLKLRFPYYIKLVTTNIFPRTMVTARLSGAGVYFGPFRSRAIAEEFDHQALDLFQLRRCQEDLEPRPDHPGCIYGEMNMCLRPCQQVVGAEEYRSEASRVSEFLSSGGRHLLQTTESARDRLSTEMEFEAAAREHKRLERIQAVLKLRDELCGDIDQLNGIAVTGSVQPTAVQLWYLIGGAWQPPVTFEVATHAGQPLSMDHRLRDVTAVVEPVKYSLRDRQEHLALLSRWFYSSWRDGEWLPFADAAKISYRKLVGCISRVARLQQVAKV